MSSPVDAFPSVFIAFLVAHYVGDYWLQTGYQAVHKGDRGLAGWLTCARHAASYTAATAVFVAVVWSVGGLPISAAGFLTGQAISAVSHLAIDRRYTLRTVVGVVDRMVNGKVNYYDNGGAEKLDQAAHLLFLFVAALVTASIQ